MTCFMVWAGIVSSAGVDSVCVIEYNGDLVCGDDIAGVAVSSAVLGGMSLIVGVHMLSLQLLQPNDLRLDL